MRAAIVAAGEEGDLGLLQREASGCALVVCADGGYHLARAAGLRVDLVVGDMDSVDLAALPSELPLEKHRFDKDESDLELAILACHRRGASQLVLLGALGGRWDHSLFNLVSALEFAHALGLATRLVGAGVEARLVGTGCELADLQGRTCSLLPLDREVRGITLEGFRYPLQNGSLLRERTRGLSNLIETSPARIRVAEGQLLLLLIE